MQDRYVGDIGDFAKFGLLRGVLSGTHLRLGVLWYAFPDEDHNKDGRHIHYLERTDENHRFFRCCDPELYDILRAMVKAKERKLAVIQERPILFSDSVYYEIPLTYESIPAAD
jgi:hypothetical protein